MGHSYENSGGGWESLTQLLKVDFLFKSEKHFNLHNFWLNTQ